MSGKPYKNIAVFASGSGTNADKIFQHFKSHPQIKVNLVLCNNPKAKVIERAHTFHIPALVFSKQIFYETESILQTL
ncbi:MAG: formyltransferase family protein, partial [Bacteroidetes bacterium]|nr:formyltransferase family protein [Bacteroidota bacterium]